EALGGAQREAAVLRGAVARHAQLLGKVLPQLLAAARVARERAAHVDHVLALRFLVEHRVEARDLVHLQRRDAQELRHEGLRLRREPALLRLAGVQHRHERGLGVRVVALERRELAHDLLAEHRSSRRRGHGQRSHSPIPKPMLPRIAITSAIMWPGSTSTSTWRLAKDGPRMRSREGDSPPSLRRKKPSSPLGFSAENQHSPGGALIDSVATMNWWISASMLVSTLVFSGKTVLSTGSSRFSTGPPGSVSS